MNYAEAVLLAPATLRGLRLVSFKSSLFLLLSLAG